MVEEDERVEAFAARALIFFPILMAVSGARNVLFDMPSILRQILFTLAVR